MIKKDDLEGKRNLSRILSSELKTKDEKILDLIKKIDKSKDMCSSSKEKEIVLTFLKYLRSEGEISERDLKMNIYLEFLEDSSEGEFLSMRKKVDVSDEEIWEIGKNSLDLLEEKTGYIETPKKGDQKFYRWNESRENSNG